MSLWEPWNRWLVTSCDMESSRAWATCKVPHGYLDHNNAATDVHVFSDLVDQTHEVGVSPASLVQVVRLLQHLRQLLAPNVSETKFFSLSNSCKICNVQDMFHRGKKLFLLSQNIFPFERKMTRLKILNIWLRLRSDNFWLPTKLTAVVCTPIDLNFDSMNRKGL